MDDIMVLLSLVSYWRHCRLCTNFEQTCTYLFVNDICHICHQLQRKFENKYTRLSPSSAGESSINKSVKTKMFRIEMTRNFDDTV